ncbi:MAG: adenosylcobalamin-dependent ribonucleoside-diphosphate reductase [Gammaproteobacteria bacterium]|nr:adenosylcobalamin-dependent ribonucleoside-diphosphate reductase [Gammaproteobacteria bacterium]
MNIFREAISEYIWNNKYRYYLKDKPVDFTIEDTWQRVAKAAASVEPTNHRKVMHKKFYDILQEFHFLPGGRILAGAGTKHRVTLFNCFVMPITEDSIRGIFDALKEGALTLQQGGGVGYDFSLLRPRGFALQSTGSTASGPVSFMSIWDAMCATMLSTGARRGAMMAVLRCDHPDIEEFIAAKSTPNQLRHFNISVLITDAFMKAVEQDSEWELVFPYVKNGLTEPTHSVEITSRRWSGGPNEIPCEIIRRVSARELWNKITKSAYDFAEPGVLFEDTINCQNNLWYREWISATNPCGEIPLPSYGACNLGSLNLTQFVLHPFTEQATIDWKKLENTTVLATRFLDNIIDISHYPLKFQKREALQTRRIGLGITGLGDTFIMLNMRYGSTTSLQLASRIMKLVSETTWHTSIELAQERGSFPVLEKEKYLAGSFVKTLPEDIQHAIQINGIRNSHHNTIAPTGTISLLANNISSGIEPVFSAYYTRTVRLQSGEEQKFEVMDYVVREWQKTHEKIELPPHWADTQMLTPQEHLHIQAAVQPYIDNAISKTINLPAAFPFKQLNDIYHQAYAQRLKGCTIYRPSPTRGEVLQPVPQEEDDDIDRNCQIC